MTDDSFFLLLDKPEGLTSQQALSRFKKKFGVKKIGHHGTLDPFATGLLLVGVNEAVKFFRFVDDARKTYEAKIAFGAATDTLDRTGQVVARRDVPQWDEAAIRAACDFLTGEVCQTVPLYSAVKVDGERLYKIARAGGDVARPEREIIVHSWQILSWKRPFLDVRVTVSRGTYVRVLAEQLAEKLGNVAHLAELRRVGLNGRDVAQAFDFVTAEVIPEDKKIAIPELFVPMPRLDCDESAYRDCVCGRPLRATQITAPDSFLSLACRGLFFGVGRQSGEDIVPERLLATAK